MYYSPDGRIRLTVITRPVDLLAIEPEWRALWASSREALLTYSVEATRALIAFPLRRRHERLWCLVGRVDGALVLVWPFIIYRHFIWRMASAIADTIDYSDPLMAEELDKPAAITAAIQVLRRSCPCDLLQFQFMRMSSRLYSLVMQARHQISTYTTDIPLAVLDGDWAAYENLLHKSQVQALARKRRNLLKLGGVSWRLLDHSEIDRVVAWMIPRKNAWLAAKHIIDETHMGSPNIIGFITALFRQLGPTGRCQIFALLHNETFVAVELCFINRTCVQWYIGTFNEEYEKYSPGMLLKQFVIRWAFDHGLDYDMLRGFGRHKSHFANRLDHATTIRLPCGPFGYAYFALRWLLRRGQLIH
jgi:CelD/BcsL family acetyltransferase involved in cellulose biosynthesis